MIKEILISEKCALCPGSERAISKTIESLNSKKNVVLLKEILHNQNVIKNLQNKGVKIKENLSEINKNDFVIVRGHGEPLSTFEYFKKNKIDYIDCTCPNVKLINLLVKEKTEDNYKIILIGKYGYNGGKMHPEVEATAGWCSTQPIFIENEEEIKNIDLSFEKYYLVCQTTFDKEKVEKFIYKIKELMTQENKIFDYKNTTCNAQRVINDCSQKLAKNVDAMIVIGGKNSSNSKELLNNVSRFTKSFFIQEPEEVLEIKELKNYSKIGITAGASTLKEDVIKTKELLESIK